jgi:hypothetical protein
MLGANLALYHFKASPATVCGLTRPRRFTGESSGQPQIGML